MHRIVVAAVFVNWLKSDHETDIARPNSQGRNDTESTSPRGKPPPDSDRPLALRNPEKLFKIASRAGRNQQVFSLRIHFFSHGNPKPGGIPCRAYIETPVCNAQIYNLSKNPSIEQIDVQFHLKTGLIFPKSFSAEIDCADTFFI